MERKPVESSNLRSVGYEAGRQVLEVEFVNGSIYQYTGVPEQIYNGLMNTESQGAFFSKAIRNKFPFSRIE